MSLVLVCFFLSGLTGLIYEILWTRMIVKLIGGAPFAISIVLTVFMAGLGLGSYIAGRSIDRIRNPADLIKIYGILELIIGGYGLVLPLLIIAFKPLYAIVYNQLFNYFMLYSFLTFVGCAVLLCIPVICMGATLPILCSFYVSSLSHIGTHTGRLYGLNTIGAAAGSLLCGFWLINLLGVWGTLIFAVVINCLIGLFCLYSGYRTDRTGIEAGKPDISSSGPVSEEEGVRERPAVLNSALVIFAVSGFCSMAYEVIWAKLLGLIVGPTTYSFTIVLVTFILGLALGSMLFGWLADRMGKVIWLLIITQITAALFALGVSQLLGDSQLFFAKLIYHFQDQFGLRSFLKAVILFFFMIVPTLCLGATFPLVGKIYTRSISKVGKSIGFAYAINTIGAVLGSFSAGFILIPLVGKENGLSLVVGLQILTSLVIGGIIVLKGKPGALKSAPLLLAALIGLILCLYFPEWNRAALSRGVYHRFDDIESDVKSYGWARALIKGEEILEKIRQGELVYYGDGIGGFTTVLRYPDPLGSYHYVMVNSGKPDASTRGDMRTQTLSAHFPMLFHKDPEKVMVLGLASGITAGEVLYYPVEQLDVIDINEQVVKASDFFIPWNNNVLTDPRTNLIIQDGRAHLNLTKERYDVIISEPSNPWMAGLATLFTEDFFSLAFDRLNENGIFVQFIHSYQMNWETFALVGRTFSTVFPNSLLLQTTPSGVGVDYLLVGLKDSKKLDPDIAKENLVYARRSRNISIGDSELMYRFIVSEDLKKLFGKGRINTDSRPILEYVAPKLIFRNDSQIMRNVQSGKWLSADTASRVQHVLMDIDAQIDFAAYAFSVNSPFPRMADISSASRLQKDRFYHYLDQYCADNSINPMEFKDRGMITRCREIQAKIINENITQFPDKVMSYYYLGQMYDLYDELDRSIAYFSKALSFNRENASGNYRLGLAFEKKNQIDKAVGYFREALRIKPNLLKARRGLADALLLQGELDDAVAEYREVLRVEPDNAGIFDKLGLAMGRQERFEEAAAYFEKALLIQPGSALIRANLAQNYLNWGKFDKAVEEYDRALQLSPDNSGILNDSAVVLIRMGVLSDAVRLLERAIKNRPDWVEPMNNLAWVLAVSKVDGVREPMEAIRLAERVCELTKNMRPDFLDTLAVAYASAGRFSDALDTGKKAMELAQSSGNEKLASEIKDHLDLFKAGKPYVE